MEILFPLLSTAYICVAIGLLIKAIHQPITGVLVVLFIASNLDNAQQLRADISVALNKYFQRGFRRFWRLMFLMGEDSCDGQICCINQSFEDDSSKSWFGRCDFVDVSPTEESNIPSLPPPSFNRRRRVMLPRFHAPNLHPEN